MSNEKSGTADSNGVDKWMTSKPKIGANIGVRSAAPPAAWSRVSGRILSEHALTPLTAPGHLRWAGPDSR